METIYDILIGQCNMAAIATKLFKDLAFEIWQHCWRRTKCFNESLIF